MNETELRVVVVGCGGFARNYLPAYRAFPGVRVVGCVDADPGAAQAMADTLGAGLATTDFAAAVEARADYAVVSTPNFLHAPQATALLRSGKHVLLQKPMARTFAEAQEIARAEAGSRRMVGLYMSMLDHGLWWWLRATLAADRPLGEITQVSMRLGHTGGLAWNQQASELWRFSREKTGGGAFIMLGVHYLHFVRWLLGLRLTRVIAQAANLHCGRVEGEDICQVSGELENGALLQLSVAWNSQGEHLSLYGTGGSIVYLDNELLRMHATRPLTSPYFNYDKPGRWQTFPGLVPPRLDDATNPHHQHAAFARALRSGGVPAVTSTDGLADLQVTDAVYRSVETGRWEEITHHG